MSLKAIHVFFILMSISLAIFFGVWALSHAKPLPNAGMFYLGILSLAAVALLATYLGWFIWKIRKGWLS